MNSSTIARPGRASIAIRESIDVDLAGIVVHEIQHRSEAVQLYLSGACKLTKELVISADYMLVGGEVGPLVATTDASSTTHVELLNAIPHLVRRMELHDYYAVLLIWEAGNSNATSSWISDCVG
jgi:hypothetical protein